jgi:NADPH-dependent ferric siderophore reductase
MGSHHGERGRAGDATDDRVAAESEPGPEPAVAVAGAAEGLDTAYERYRQARDRYAEAKYEYKAAKYALKAARIRADRDSGRGDGRYDKDRYRKHHGHHGDRRYDDARRLEAEWTAVRGDRPDIGGNRRGAEVAVRERSTRKQLVLQVVETERIGEHMQRITLGGEGFEDFRDNRYTDKYVKILFVDPALGLEPPYDVQSLRRSLPKHQRPVRRTYTVHSVDPAARTLAVDVVLHGDSGVASRWAARAQVGEKVAFSGPGGKYAPDPRADWHLLAGDESALPAIEAALAALPSDAVGIAFIEVAGPADERTLEHPPGVEVRWLHREPAGTDAVPVPPEDDRTAVLATDPAARPAAGPAARLGGRAPSVLVAAVESMAWRPGRVHAFVHGEKSAVKRLRGHLLEERRVDKRMLSLSSYWTRGSSED